MNQTIRSIVAMPSQRSGLVLASHVPHDGSRVLASLKPTVGTVITTSPACESTTCIILSTAASSQDWRRSRVTMLLALARTSFQRFMRFFFLSSCRSAPLTRCGSALSRCGSLEPAVRPLFMPVVGYTLFSLCCWLYFFLVAYVTIHPSLVDFQPSPALGRSL